MAKNWTRERREANLFWVVIFSLTSYLTLQLGQYLQYQWLEGYAMHFWSWTHEKCLLRTNARVCVWGRETCRMLNLLFPKRVTHSMGRVWIAEIFSQILKFSPVWQPRFFDHPQANFFIRFLPYLENEIKITLKIVRLTFLVAIPQNGSFIICLTTDTIIILGHLFLQIS